MTDEVDAPQYPIESVDRVLKLLMLFRDQPELRLADVRRNLEVGQSTAHRLMMMFLYRGFAVQDPVTKIYRAGPALFDVGLSVVHNFDLRVLGRPVLESLSATCGETAHLGVLEGAQVRFVDCVESHAVLRIGARVGALTPAHATSLGKAMLATLSDEAVKRLYPRPKLTAITPHTIARRSDLLDELSRTRDRGYAENNEESEIGVSSTASAVVHRSRGMLGALSIAAPALRLTPDARKEHARALQDASERLAASL